LHLNSIKLFFLYKYCRFYILICFLEKFKPGLNYTFLGEREREILNKTL